MKQAGLAKRVIEALQLEGQPPAGSPAKGFLPLGKEGELAHGSCSYASAAGMLQHLHGHSRPGISFAASQAARYARAPKRPHEIALERAGRCLKGTAEEGTIFKPNAKPENLKIGAYADADFASGWGTEDGSSPGSAKPRAGCAAELMGCPAAWCSKLQASIAQPTMEAEHTALSMPLRAAIPLLEATKAIAAGLSQLAKHRLATFKATAHGGSQGALSLATSPAGRGTPRSKLYALKLHWLRSWLEPKAVEIACCKPEDQKADFLTKSMPTPACKANRKLPVGW